MKSAVLIAFAVLQLLCCALAAAQARNTTGSAIEDVIRFPGAGTLRGQTTPAREARAYGSDGAALPGKRIEAVADIAGKWRYQETRNNVEIKAVRVPVRTTNLTLELREDGTYTLDYEVYWGLGNGDPKGQQAGLIVKERGKYALSGSILLLEAEPLEAIEQGRFERTTRTVPADKRAYIARLETGVGLNIAGACAAYQIETPCASSRSVWIPLTRPERRSSPRIR